MDLNSCVIGVLPSLGKKKYATTSTTAERLFDPDPSGAGKGEMVMTIIPYTGNS